VISVAGLKGAVPIVLATFPLTAGTDDADLIFNMVFFVVLVTVLLQGLAMLPIINALGMEDQQPGWSPVAQALPLGGIELDLVEIQVTEGLDIVGARLADTSLPQGALVTAVVRDHDVVIPDGDTDLRVGDVLLITSKRDRGAIEHLTAWARGEDDQTG
jgi:cell volume regulation protein A